VLLAIAAASSKEPAGLDEIVAAADMINHAILLPAEVEGAVQRLGGIGWVSVEGTRFSLTGEARRLLEKTRSRSILAHWDRITASWEKDDAEAPTLLDWDLDAGEFADAIQKYRQRVAKFRTKLPRH
jgi:hypothetical protein